MRDLIIEKLKTIEKAANVRILLYCRVRQPGMGLCVS